VSLVPKDLTPVYNQTIGKGAGAHRWQRPVYVDHLPPCNHACPAGENIQAWLALAQAGDYELAWRTYMEENPLPGTHGRACYHPCESACNRQFLDSAVSIHSLDRFLGDLANPEPGGMMHYGIPAYRLRFVVAINNVQDRFAQARRTGIPVVPPDIPAQPSPGAPLTKNRTA
jgi:NADPH-dependent glutamate synthase beta subunit-like oxidoreductase